MSTPRESNYMMPPEWVPHSACWMAWPCQPKTHPDMEAARDAYAAIARAIARFEPLKMLANPDDCENARKRCGESVEVVPMPIDDAWTRDTGPTYVIDGKGSLGGVDWPFNGWGKFPDHQEDAKTASRILEQTRALRFQAPIILEGGGIHTDGDGTLLTTENVVLNSNRNPGLTKKEADEVFRAFLGVDTIIWLDKAMDFDKLEIIEIRQPARRDFRDNRLAFSYINHYIANGGVVLPTFDDPMDEQARRVFAKVFPDREISQVPGTEVVDAGGCIHCITQQQPAP